MEKASVNSLDSQSLSSSVWCKKDKAIFLDTTLSHKKQKTAVVSPPPTPVHQTIDCAHPDNAIRNNSSTPTSPQYADYCQLNKRTNTFVKTYAIKAHALKSHTCQGTFTLDVYQEFKNTAIHPKTALHTSSKCRTKQRFSTHLRPEAATFAMLNTYPVHEGPVVKKLLKAAGDSRKKSKQLCSRRPDTAAIKDRIVKKKRRTLTVIKQTENYCKVNSGEQPQVSSMVGAVTSIRHTTAATSTKKKRVTISSILPVGKEAQAAFDALDIDSADDAFYPEGWIPSKHALEEQTNSIKFTWKGSPMNIEGQAYYEHLHSFEALIASSLRLSPVQYLKCKRTLIMAAKTLKEQEVPFTKSVAQRLCRVDVNKTSALWTIFGQLGWFN